jgi:hypothetical protein
VKIRSNLLKSEVFKKANKILPGPLYMSQVNNEIIKLLFFSFGTAGFKIEGLQQFIDLSDQVGAQIITLHAANFYELPKGGEEKRPPV